MIRTGVKPVAVVVAGMLLMSACTGTAQPGPTDTSASDESSPAPSSATTTASVPADSPSPSSPQGTTTPATTPSEASAEPTSGGELPTFPANPAPDSAEPSEGTVLHLTDLRSASHEGYDRVVLQFEGNGEPGWHAAYTSDPVAAGSGRPIQVAGDSALDISVSMGSVPEGGEMQVSPGKRNPNLAEVEQIYLGGWFEGYLQIVLGVDSDQPPFRVFSLDDPTRVVIDVVHVGD